MSNGWKIVGPTPRLTGRQLLPVRVQPIVRREVSHVETEIVLSKPLLLAEVVQRIRVLPVRVSSQLDYKGPSDLPEVRAMILANVCLSLFRKLYSTS